MRGIVSRTLVLTVFISFIPGLLGFQDSDTYNQEYDLFEKAEAEKDSADTLSKQTIGEGFNRRLRFDGGGGGRLISLPVWF